MGLSIAVGFVVDDAIVMVENIARHIEMGKTPLRAALDGAGEIGFTILSISISNDTPSAAIASVVQSMSKRLLADVATHANIPARPNASIPQRLATAIPSTALSVSGHCNDKYRPRAAAMRQKPRRGADCGAAGTGRPARLPGS